MTLRGCRVGREGRARGLEHALTPRTLDALADVRPDLSEGRRRPLRSLSRRRLEAGARPRNAAGLIDLLRLHPPFGALQRFDLLSEMLWASSDENRVHRQTVN